MTFFCLGWICWNSILICCTHTQNESWDRPATSQVCTVDCMTQKNSIFITNQKLWRPADAKNFKQQVSWSLKAIKCHLVTLHMMPHSMPWLYQNVGKNILREIVDRNYIDLFLQFWRCSVSFVGWYKCLHRSNKLLYWLLLYCWNWLPKKQENHFFVFDKYFIFFMIEKKTVWMVDIFL